MHGNICDTPKVHDIDELKQSLTPGTNVSEPVFVLKEGILAFQSHKM